MSGIDALSQDALEALQQTLDLSKEELEQLAQSFKNIESLEQALKTLQLAKRLNEQEQLDGDAGKGCESLEDYEKLYRKMLADAQSTDQNGSSQPLGGDVSGNQQGMGGHGSGQGGRAPEKHTDTTFVPELSKSALTAGKMLLLQKVQELGPAGEANEDYQKLIEKIKQGVSEAVLKEEIPPGYHEIVKKYFDSIGEKDNDKSSSE
ncbi:MAG: hypothetical protein ABIH42_10905 [Planctomycetota bacterium]